MDMGWRRSLSRSVHSPRRPERGVHGEEASVNDNNHVYKIIELVGSSNEGLESAIQNALARANESVQNIDWFEVREIRGAVSGGQVGWYQVKVGIGFRVESGGAVGA